MNPVFSLDIPHLSFYLFAFFAFWQLLYLVRFWLRLAAFSPGEKNINQRAEPVSIVISARNEAENLREHLPYFLHQDYPVYEVIVVNDCSFDDTDRVLEEYQLQFPDKLNVITLQEQEKYPTDKKFALTIGFKAAKYDVLLLSDADCHPISDQWIRMMVRRYQDQSEIVLGYGRYEKENSFLNLCIQFDTLMTGLQSLSFALAKMPYMGVGRNLSYLKALFFQNKGFVKFIHRPCGDDDLFINQVANSHNTQIAIEPESVTVSKAEKTWGSWFKQKRRHLSTSKHYKAKHLFWLVIGNISFPFSVITFGVSMLLWYQQKEMVLLFGPLMGAVYFLRWLCMILVAVKLKEKRIIAFIPIMELVYPILHILWRLKPYTNRQR